MGGFFYVMIFKSMVNNKNNKQKKEKNKTY